MPNNNSEQLATATDRLPCPSMPSPTAGWPVGRARGLGAYVTSLLLLAHVALAGCAGTVDEVDVDQVALSIGSGRLTMNVGESVLLEAAVTVSGPAQLYTISYRSNSAAVTVAPDGVVTAVAAGSAQIDATVTLVDSGAAASAQVQVTVGSTATPTTTVSFASTTADIPNPDRGFYGWAGSDFVNSFDLGSVQGAYSEGKRLVFAKVQLDSYRTSDLPSAFLTTLNARFAAVRAAGMKVTLLFNYDFTSAGNDATAAQIKRHLEQLKPVLQANADVIPYMRAGFIGAWGEWHSSLAGNTCGYGSPSGISCATADANRLIVRDALLANVPATTQIGFRYPGDLIKWYPSPTQQSRAGIHNDCFQAGPSDTGTYRSTAERDYARKLSETTAFGGENCHNAEPPLRNTCADILAEGPAYHVAWLNGSDWSGFMTAWRNGGCYAQVSAFMGYRIQLDRVTHPTSALRGTAIAVNVDLRNVGWARMFATRNLVVTLRHKASGALLTGTSALDLRTLPAQASTSTSVPVTVSVPAGAATGDYDVLLGLPDVFPTTASDVRFSARFANAASSLKGQAWDATAGRFSTGTVLRVN